jgi:thymidylate synthase (FAD)
MNQYYPVLDRGFVSLVDKMGDDSSIVQAARVSYGSGTKTVSDDRGLIRYLLRHKHTTPIEMVVFKFHIAMPIHCHRQFIRHRMSTTNEYSARYSVVPEIYYDEYSLNLQSKNNKQGRNDSELENSESFKKRINDNEETAFKIYEEMIEAGVAREVARMHLPLNSYTYFYWKIDLHNLLHFLRLRCDAHAQYEIRQYSNTLAGIVKQCCPLAFEAWEDYSFYASNWTRLDKKFLNYLIYMYGDSNYDFDFKWAKQFYDNGRSEKHTPKHKEIGMSDRELVEFWDKLEEPEPVDFTLPEPKDSLYFENMIKNAS